MPFLDIKKLFKSFRFAARGVFYVIKNEQNFRIQLFVAVVVVALAIYFKVEQWQAVALSMLIGAVLILELVNTIFEKISDMLQPRIHHYVAIIKDIMAAAVFIASFGALVIGVIIFWPHVFG